MSDDRSVDAAKAAWQSQRVDTPLLSIDYLRNRTLEHAQASRTRSLLEFLLGGTAVVLGVWSASAIDGILLRVGVLVMLAGILCSLYERRRRGAWSLTLEGSAADGLHFYKQELARLRDRHRALWKIHLPASLPGAVILLAWAFIERPDDRQRVALVASAVAVWIIVMLRHEAQEAKRYQHELDALEGNG